MSENFKKIIIIMLGWFVFLFFILFIKLHAEFLDKMRNEREPHLDKTAFYFCHFFMARQKCLLHLLPFIIMSLPVLNKTKQNNNT